MQSSPLGTQDRLRAFLPAPLIRKWCQDGGHTPVWGSWLTGSLMHCDITGFTAMSEALTTLGKEGAEVMVGILNRFFERMLGIAEGWGGAQMKFGGDAMLLLFEGERHAERSAVCALEMQRAMRDFRSVAAGDSRHQLRMRIGIHAGRFYSASIGDPQLMLHYMLSGADVNRTAAAEPIASPGKVVVTGELAQLLPRGSSVTPVSDGLFRISRVSYKRAVKIPNQEKQVELPAALADYLPAPLRDAPFATSAAGEHRRVTVMFINVLGLARLLAADDEAGLHELDTYVRTLVQVLDRYGGFLLGSDVAEEGEKLIVLFGAPVSRERLEEAAVSCAVEFDCAAVARGLRLKHRIGINSGFAFAGEVGSIRRREYTVIGDVVNLAARLMAAAHPGEIIVSSQTASAAGHGFGWQRMRPLKVKGKAAPVRAMRVASDRQRGDDDERAAPLVGRRRELEQLERISRRVEGGRPQWAFVHADAGMGKSRLMRELAGRLSERGWLTTVTECQAHTSQVPLAPWAALLKSMLNGSEPATSWPTLESALRRLGRPDETGAAMLAPILGIAVPERLAGRLTQGESRQEKLAEVLARLLDVRAADRALLLMIDDAHWMDAASTELLGAVLMRLSAHVFVCVTSRNPTAPTVTRRLAQRPALTLTLQPLSLEDARLLVAGAGGREELAQEMIDRAQGNPLFLREFIRSGAGVLQTVPETINDLIMARFDGLPIKLKSVLRVAAVIGPSFEPAAVTSLLEGRTDGRQVQRALRLLASRGFTESAGEKAYRFTHALLQDVVYETLPYDQRRRLHRGVMHYLETGFEGRLDSVCELLVHHAQKAGEGPRVARYSVMSGDRAARIFANEAAIRYYGQALYALDSCRAGGQVDRSFIHELIGDCLETLGRHGEAAESYRQALQVLQQRGRPIRARYLGCRTIRLSRNANLCRKIGVSLERASQYEEAIGWLDNALAALPARNARLGAQIAAAKSVSLFRKGMYQQGIDWGRRALRLARGSGDRRQIAYAQNMLANSYMEGGDLHRAVNHLRRAVRLYHELGDFQGQASANNNLGMCYHLQGTLDAALYYYDVALQADRRVGDAVDAAVVESNIGEVLLMLGRTGEAMNSLTRVISATRSVADLAALSGLAHVNLSRCHLALGQTEAAERYLRRGQRLLRRVGAAGLLVEAQMQHAELLLAKGNAALARRVVSAALREARNLHAGLLEARGERLLGEALLRIGRVQLAAEHLRESVTRSRRAGAVHEEAQAALALAECLKTLGKSPPRASSYPEPPGRNLRKGGQRGGGVMPEHAAPR